MGFNSFGSRVNLAVVHKLLVCRLFYFSGKKCCHFQVLGSGCCNIIIRVFSNFTSFEYNNLVFEFLTCSIVKIRLCSNEEMVVPLACGSTRHSKTFDFGRCLGLRLLPCYRAARTPSKQPLSDTAIATTLLSTFARHQNSLNINWVTEEASKAGIGLSDTATITTPLRQKINWMRASQKKEDLWLHCLLLH